MAHSRISYNYNLYLWFGIALFILGFTGEMLSSSTLLPSLLISCLCLGIGFFSRPVRTLLLVDIWLISYIYLYMSEYILSQENVMMFFGSTITTSTEGYIVASFGASIIGYSFCRPRINSATLLNKQLLNNLQYKNNAVSDDTIRSTIAASQQINVRNVAKEIIPFPIVLFIFLLAITCIYYITEVISLQQLLFAGRSQRTLDIEVNLLETLLETSLVAYPASVLFVVRKYTVPKLLLLLLLSIVGICLLSIFALGTRLLLGFLFGGVMLPFIIGSVLTSRQWLGLILLVVLLLTASSIMLNTRGAGIGDSSIRFSGGLQDFIQPESLLSAEGILSTNALIHLSQSYPAWNWNRLPENLFLAYWWVPRAIWPEKPQMAGYWVIRELSSQGGFSDAHSASGGFAMPALLDFGPTGGAFFSILYGIALGKLENFALQHRSPDQISIVISGYLYFAVFFMMRSLHTSLIFLSLCILMSVTPLYVIIRLLHSRSHKGRKKINPITPVRYS